MPRRRRRSRVRHWNGHADERGVAGNEFERGPGRALEVPEIEAARGRQIGLFAPDSARTEEAIATARYLRAKLGTGAVLRAKVTDEAARLPERATEWVEVIA